MTPNYRLMRLALVVLLLPGLGATKKSSKPPLPEGWITYPTPMEGGFAIECGNYASRSWKVAYDHDHNALGINPVATVSQPALELPAQLKPEPGMTGRESSWKISTGWLLGFDQGEYGGGLWRTNNDGSESKQLLNRSVKGIVSTSHGIFVLTALMHRSVDLGKVYTLDADGQGELHPLLDLDGAPLAYFRESADSLLVATTHGISRVSATGTVEVLSTEPFARLFPNSIAEESDGTIYVGMRMFVMRLMHDDRGYFQEWMVSNECRRFEAKHFDCVCVASAK